MLLAWDKYQVLKPSATVLVAVKPLGGVVTNVIPAQ